MTLKLPLLGLLDSFILGCVEEVEGWNRVRKQPQDYR